jgi:glycosyltransferase involved in cell wall biosynthesis
MPIISFIIPTKDRDAILFQSLERLLSSVESETVEVLVINDNHDRQLVLPKHFDIVKVVQNQGKGVASARNFGASIARSPLLWFLDDDIWLSKEVFRQGLKLQTTNPGSVFNFNWTYPDVLRERISNEPFGRFLEAIEFTTMKGWCRGMKWEDNTLMETQWLAGATLLIPADRYREVNGYDPSFPLAGFEDYDFSVRVRKRGIPCFIDARVMTYHNEENKTSLRGFLKRTFQNAITRRHAVSIGYEDQRLDYSFFKHIAYKLLTIVEPILLLAMENWPAIKGIDKLYFRLCHVLIGLNMYKGYYFNDVSK